MKHLRKESIEAGFFLLLFFLSLNLNAEDIPRGNMIDSIKVSGFPEENYQAYFPSNFSYTDTNPKVMFIFDPGARGHIGINAFIEIAEEYNLILFCSNSIKNDLYSKNIPLAKRFIADAELTFRLNNYRRFLAGFSGGSRLASELSKHLPCEVIVACGAGFAETPDNLGEMKTRSYIGITGDLDMNYLEMAKNHDWMDKNHIPNLFITFNGGHHWPESQILADAFSNLFYKEIKSEEKKQKILKRNQLRLNQLLELEEYDKIDFYFRFLENNLLENKEKSSLRSDFIAISKLNAFKKHTRKHQKTLKKEEEIKEELKKRFERDLNCDHDSIYQYWKETIQQLRKYSKSSNVFYRKMGKRIESYLYITCIEIGNYSLKLNYLTANNFCNRLLSLINPEKYQPYYQLAINYSHLEDKEKAFYYLKKLNQTKFHQFSMIKESPLYKKYHQTKKFKKIFNEIAEKELAKQTQKKE